MSSGFNLLSVCQATNVYAPLGRSSRTKCPAESVTAKCGEGSTIALLDGMARTATATAMMRTELTIIRRDQFLCLLRTEPQLAAHL